MKPRIKSRVVGRAFGLFVIVAMITASTPMDAVAVRGDGDADAGAVLEAPRLRFPAVHFPNKPADPIGERHAATAGWLTALDAAVADEERAAQAREAAAKAKAEAEAKAKAEAAAAEKARREAEAKAKAEAAEQARREAEAAARAKAQAAAARQAASKPAASGFRGRNHFWYPALGISQSVAWFPCSRAEAPGNAVYRWGCAGSGNVYLMAHAWGKFKALNRAYYNGALSSGQLAVYADNNGRVHYYRLAWYKTGPPTAAQSWAWAGQSRSSMTLQTCIGASSEGRLFVRFHEVRAP